MGKQEDFQQIYQDLRDVYDDSGELASAILPFVSLTNDFQLAATMLHTQLQTMHGLRV